MRRREFIGALSGAAFLWSPASFAQQPKKIHRIGVLWHGANVEEEAIYLAALRKGLLDMGYVEGQNIVLEMRFPAEQYERFFVLAAELARQKLDVLVSAAGDRRHRLPSCDNDNPDCRRQCPRSGRTKAGREPRPAGRELDGVIEHGRRADEETPRARERDDQRPVARGIACEHLG